MPLADDAIYIAYDIYEDMTQFLTAAMQTAGFVGRAETRDVLHAPPDDRADIAFLLKTLPCLDQLEKGAAARLLDTLQATYLLVSYPVSSLGGRHKGMVDTYDAQFQTLISGRPWTVQRCLFETELAFLVHTQREKVNDGPAV